MRSVERKVTIHSDERKLRNHIDLAQYAGFPVYLFDFEFLLGHVPQITTWKREKIETIIGARVDHVLDRADVRIAGGPGFYVIFSSRDAEIAQVRANVISTDILKHFFGTESLIPEAARAFCRLSDLKSVAGDLGVKLPSDQEIAAAAVGAAKKRVDQDNVAQEQQPASSLIADMNALFRRHFGEQRREPPKFLFAPIWDSAQERTASFACVPALSRVRGNVAEKPGLAATICDTDISALAFGLKGAWHVVSRGEIALITVPVHIETLSWSKYRTAYLQELAQIEHSLLNLLAFRIYGLDTGASLSQLKQGVSVLRRHAKRIFAYLPSVGIDFSNAGVMGLTGIFASAPDHIFRSGDLALLTVVASKLRRICANQNAFACVDNVQCGAAVGLLKSQGIRFVAGPIFDRPSEEPGPVKPFPLSDIIGTSLVGI